jgi:hypothetical protein
MAKALFPTFQSSTTLASRATAGGNAISVLEQDAVQPVQGQVMLSAETG